MSAPCLLRVGSGTARSSVAQWAGERAQNGMCSPARAVLLPCSRARLCMRRGVSRSFFAFFSRFFLSGRERCEGGQNARARDCLCLYLMARRVRRGFTAVVGFFSLSSPDRPQQRASPRARLSGRRVSTVFTSSLCLVEVDGRGFPVAGPQRTLLLRTCTLLTTVVWPCAGLGSSRRASRMAAMWQSLACAGALGAPTVWLSRRGAGDTSRASNLSSHEKGSAAGSVDCCHVLSWRALRPTLWCSAFGPIFCPPMGYRCGEPW